MKTPDNSIKLEETEKIKEIPSERKLESVKITEKKVGDSLAVQTFLLQKQSELQKQIRSLKFAFIALIILFLTNSIVTAANVYFIREAKQDRVNIMSILDLERNMLHEKISEISKGLAVFLKDEKEQ